MSVDSTARFGFLEWASDFFRTQRIADALVCAARGLASNQGAEACALQLKGDDRLYAWPMLTSSQKHRFDSAFRSGAPHEETGFNFLPLEVGRRRLGFVGIFSGDSKGVPLTDTHLMVGMIAGHVEPLRTIDMVSAIDRARDAELEMDLALQKILDFAVGDCNFEFAQVSLANIQRNELRCVQSRNIAPEWHAMVRYKLSDEDILTSVYHTGRREVVRGTRHALFNENIYKRFAHHKLARVWMPLRSRNSIIGVLEAGGLNSRSDQFLAEENIDRLEAMANRRVQFCNGSPPKRALDLLAQSLRGVLDAVDVAVTLWEGDFCVVDGWSGEGAISFADLEHREHLLTNDVPLATDWQQKIDSSGRPLLLFPLHVGEVSGFISVHLRESTVNQEFDGIWTALYERLMALLAGDVTRLTAWMSLEHERVIAHLREIKSILAGADKLDDALQEVADRALIMLRARSVIIFDYQAEPQQFGLLRASSGDFLAPLCRELPGDIFTPLFGGEDKKFVSDLPASEFALPRKNDGWDGRFVNREQLGSSAMFRLRAGAPADTVGALFVNHAEKRSEFSATYKREAEELAGTAAAVISAYRLGEREQRAKTRSEKIQKGLREVDGLLLRNIQGLDRTEVCRLVLTWLIDILHCHLGAVLLTSGAGPTLEFAAFHAFDPPRDGYSREAGIIGNAFGSKKPIFVPDTEKEPMYRVLAENVPRMGSELAVPLLDGGADARGVINLEHPNKRHFGPEDLYVVQLFASRIVFVSQLADLYKDLNEQINPRTAFGRIAVRLQDADWDLMKSLRFLLAGVTTGESLGFCRALLFLLDEDRAVLKGVLGVGQPTAAEALQLWDRYRRERSGKSFDERLKLLFEDIDRIHEEIQRNPRAEPELSASIQRLAWKAEDVGGVLKECLNQSSAATRRGGSFAEDWLGRELHKQIRGEFGDWPFWAVPLVVGGKALGVLVVDQGFLGGRAADEPPDVEKRSLEAFVEMMAQTVEASRLREGAWTAIYEDLFHQIESPLNNAGTVLRPCLDIALPVADSGRIRLALEQFESAQAVANSVKVLADVRRGRDLRAGMTEEPVSEMVELVRGLVVTHRQLQPDVSLGLSVDAPVGAADECPQIRWDRQLYKQAFLAVLTNAIHYTEGSSVQVSIRRHVAAEVDVSNPAKPHSPQEVAQCLGEETRGSAGFKKRPHGGGRGLPLAKRIIEAHNGTINPDCQNGLWRVILTLPFI